MIRPSGIPITIESETTDKKAAVYHDKGEYVIKLRWNTLITGNTFVVDVGANGASLNLANYHSLDIRIAKVDPEREEGYISVTPVDFWVNLVDVYGNESDPRPLSIYGTLPLNIHSDVHGWVPLMKTIRIPLTEFKAAPGKTFNLASISSVKLIFPYTLTSSYGTIYIGDIRLSRTFQ